MTAPRPSARAHSEEELLEQWEFLDRLVERQANLLRSGVQDSEELDDPLPARAEADPLEEEVTTLRAELAAQVEARTLVEHRAAELDRRLSTAVRELARTRQAHADALAALRAAQGEMESLRDQLERRRRGVWPFRRR